MTSATAEEMLPGELASRILIAIGTGRSPSALGVPDTPVARQMQAAIELDLSRMPASSALEIPFDYNLDLDDDLDRVAKQGNGGSRRPRDWPGWRHDLQLIKQYTGKIRAAFAQAISEAERLIRDWWSGALTVTRNVLVAMIEELLSTRLGQVLRNLWREAFYLGDRSAAMLTGQVAEGDWGGWQPGDPDAARLVDTGQHLQALLNSYGVTTIKSIASSRMDELAAAISNAVNTGASADSVARQLPQILQVPQRAEMIAQTEIARAVSAATITRYTQDGITRKEWLVAPDERVCKVCEANKDQGAIETSRLFLSGVDAPPAHVRCRCAAIPAKVPGADLTGYPALNPPAVVAAKRFSPAEARDSRGWWTRSAGSDQPLTGSDVHKALGTPELTPEEKQAIWQYTTAPGMHGYINSALRQGSDPGWVGKSLDGIIARSGRLTKPALVYRAAPWRGLKPGDVFTDKGYVSTTVDEDHAAKNFTEPPPYLSGSGRFPLAKITLPAGMKALSAHNELHRSQDEYDDNEVLLPHGTSFKVTGTSTYPLKMGYMSEPEPLTVLEMEAVPPS